MIPASLLRRPRAPILPLLLAAALVATTSLSCFSERSQVTDPGGDDCSIPASAIGPNRAVVLIRGFAFHPDTVRIRPGTRVTWVNCEASGIDPHTATAAGVFDSGLMQPGDSFAREFGAAGATDYICIPHPFMHGTILVE